MSKERKEGRQKPYKSSVQMGLLRFRQWLGDSSHQMSVPDADTKFLRFGAPYYLFLFMYFLRRMPLIFKGAACNIGCKWLLR